MMPRRAELKIDGRGESQIPELHNQNIGTSNWTPYHNKCRQKLLSPENHIDFGQRLHTFSAKIAYIFGQNRYDFS